MYYLVVMVFYVNFVWIINKIEVSIGNIGLNILKYEYDINMILYGFFCIFKV